MRLYRYWQWIYDNPYILLLCTSLFWSSNVVIGRAAADLIDPYTLSLFRWILAGAVILPFAYRHMRADRAQIKQHFSLFLVLAFTGIASFNTLLYLALHYTTVVNSAIIQSLLPIFTACLMFILFKQLLKPVQLFGIFLGIIGVIILVTLGRPWNLFSLHFNTGDTLMLIAMVLYAIYSVLLARLPKVHWLTTIGTTFIIGAATLLPFWLWVTDFAKLAPILISPDSWLVIGYVAIFPSVVGYTFYNRAVVLIGATNTTSFINFIPLFSVILAMVFLAERLSYYHFIGGLAIVAGVYLVQKYGLKLKASQSPPN